MSKAHDDSKFWLYTTHDPKTSEGSDVTIGIPKHMTTQITKKYELAGYLLGLFFHAS
jgi:hypothetical protein